MLIEKHSKNLLFYLLKLNTTSIKDFFENFLIHFCYNKNFYSIPLLLLFSKRRFFIWSVHVEQKS